MTMVNDISNARLGLNGEAILYSYRAINLEVG